MYRNVGLLQIRNWQIAQQTLRVRSLTRWQHFAEWNGTMAAVLRVWRKVENPIPSNMKSILQISSRSDLKRRNQDYWGCYCFRDIAGFLCSWSHPSYSTQIFFGGGAGGSSCWARSPMLGIMSYSSSCSYRTMHYSAKRGLAIACRPYVRLYDTYRKSDVCLSVCNVQIPWSHRLRNTEKIIYEWIALGTCLNKMTPNIGDLVQREHPQN